MIGTSRGTLRRSIIGSVIPSFNESHWVDRDDNGLGFVEPFGVKLCNVKQVHQRKLVQLERHDTPAICGGLMGRPCLAPEGRILVCGYR
jgi:hypothetical protein